MAYISEDGRVLQTEPWGLQSIYKFFTGLFGMIMMFFVTLVNPDSSSSGNEHMRNFRPGSGPPRPPSRRMGRPNLGHNVDIPFGGCSSCSR